MQVQDDAEPGALHRRILEQVREHDGISFARFMEAALYHPELGYYARERRPWGARGDYLTVPQVHGALGHAVARTAIEIDVALGRAGRFDLVEHGAGDGALLESTLDAIEGGDPELSRRLRVVAVERSERARVEIAARLGDRVEVVAAGTDGPARVQGLIYSNELLDAFPVERVTRVDGELRQSVVVERDGELVETFRPPPTAEVLEYLTEGEIEIREGQVAEVCPAATRWVRAVAAGLEAGGLLTVDYGHETAALYGESRPAGTLLCHRHYRLDDDPLQQVGDKDITAHVDFGNLRRAGRRAGLVDGELCSLRVLLIGTGAAEAAARGPAPERLALRHLLVSEVGEAHRALLQTRGLPAGTPAFGRARLTIEP